MMHLFKIIAWYKSIDIIPYLTGFQTKDKFACLVCGHKMVHWCSRSLGKEVFEEYTNFLP